MLFSVFKFASLALLGSVIADEAVEVLHDSDFDDFLKSHPKTLVKFYAPWCGHCKKLAPEYEKAAAELKAKGVTLAKVDATEEKAIAARFDIKGYPTLLWFAEGGDAQEYDGGRNAEGIKDWVETMTGPAVKVVDAAEEPTSKPVFVFYGPQMSMAFEKFASGNRKVASFLYVKADASKLTLQHKGEEVIETTDAQVFDDADKLKEFWASNSFPLFGMLDGESYSKYMGRSDYGLVWCLFPMESSEEFTTVVAKYRTMMTTIAKAHPSYSFTYTDTVQFKGAVENMLGVKEFPALVVYKKSGDKLKFVFKGEMTEDAINAFFAGVEDGSIEPTLRSEDVPAENDAPVRVIVGKTLQEEVFQADKDVLLEVYAPWCGHCKKLEPEYEKVAKKIRKEGVDDMVMLAKMDGTVNDSPVESIHWDGFPTLYYVKAGSSTPEKYDGGRDAKGIWKWIKKNHSKGDELSAKVKANKEAKESDKDEL